jgi:hypothetical protein
MTDINQSVNSALDIGYLKSASKMLAKIDKLTNAQTSEIQRALRDLDDEVSRLDEAGEMLTRDNAYLEKVLRLLAAAFIATANLIDDNSLAIEESGQIIAPVAVTAKIFSQLTKTTGNPVMPGKLAGYIKALDRLGVDWTAPRTLDFAKKYTETAAWNARMAKWGEGYSDLIKKTVLDGIESGWGPKYTAGKLRKLVQTMPKYAAENLTRTLQLTSYRESALAMEMLNGGFIEYKIRVSALMPASCLACVSLHGTRLEKGERLDDHYNGFCSEIYMTPGMELPKFMQADSTPGHRNFVPWQNGTDWFNSLSPERQAQQRSFAQSPAKFRAFQAGHPLSEFVGTHNDDVFGTMPIEKSLIGALGDAGKDFYSRNQED